MPHWFPEATRENLPQTPPQKARRHSRDMPSRTSSAKNQSYPVAVAASFCLPLRLLWFRNLAVLRGILRLGFRGLPGKRFRQCSTVGALELLNLRAGTKQQQQSHRQQQREYLLVCCFHSRSFQIRIFRFGPNRRRRIRCDCFLRWRSCARSSGWRSSYG